MSAGIAYERIVAALEARGHRTKPEGRSGSAARAMCPVHGVNGKTSLRITGIDGQVLVHCFAGCQVEDILAALDLRLPDLFDSPTGKTYNYTDLSGLIVRSVHRTPDKSFPQSGNTKSTLLYKLPAVVEAVAHNQPVYLVEGEKDADALESLGAVATTSPQGVDSWHKVDPSPLYGANVRVIPDDDEPGQRYAQAISDTLDGKAELTFLHAKAGKDAADHIAAGYGLDDLEPFDLNVAPELADLLRITTASDVEITRVKYLWEHRVPLGAMTLMPGEEGIGKTTVGVWIIAGTTRGSLRGELFGHPRDVLVLAPEDGLEDVFTPRLREAGADLTRVHYIKARVAADGSDLDVIVPRDLNVLTMAVERYDAAFVWIDSLVTTLPDDLKSISYKDTAKALKKLTGWAEANKIAVAAPWHLNKASGSDTAIRIMDSRAFRTAVRSMLLIVADPEAEEGEQQGIVALDKANASTLAVPALRYRINSAPYVVEEVDQETGEIREIDASCGVVEWIGAVEGDGRAIARAMLAPAIEKEGTPIAWLREYLTAAGETSRVDVLKAGEAAGFSESSIARAARSLPVSSTEQSGQDPETRRPYRRSLWKLPQSGHTRTTDRTDTTGETSLDRTEPIDAGQAQSCQSGQSGQSRRTEKPGDSTGEAPDQPTLDDAIEPERAALDWEELWKDDPAVTLVRNELGGVAIDEEAN